MGVELNILKFIQCEGYFSEWWEKESNEADICKFGAPTGKIWGKIDPVAQLVIDCIIVYW